MPLRRATHVVAPLIAVLLSCPLVWAAEVNCGVASTMDFAHLLGEPLDTAQHRSLQDAYPGAEASMLDIKRAAESVGIPLLGTKASFSELTDEVHGPKIIHLTAPDHFLVVARVSGEWVQLLDGGRVVVVPREEIEKRYSGYALILEESTDDLGDPRLELDEFHYPFGIVGVGQKVQHAFKVTNAGDQDLVLALQSSGCSGLPASIGKETLAPGESTDLTVDFTVRFSGSFMRSAKPVTNDLTQPVAFITVHGKVPHNLRVYPDRLLLAGPKGDTLSAKISVSGPAEMDLADLHCKQNLFDVQVSPPEVSEDERKTWRITLGSKPETLVGEFTDELSIETTHADRPLITIPIKGSVRGDLAIMPPSAFFGFAKRGEDAAATITIDSRPGARLKLLDIAPSGPAIKVTQSETEGGYSLTVSVPTDNLGVLEGEVVVTTDVPGEETLRIPVYAHIVDPESPLAAPDDR